ncbi:hypothetical protein BV20DRAFT_546299 [Pilatotrama ljubarskyi]|nr:hypothetical protein BV20DRAFT_546299 [Pilatotrama ljubarskyi]
MKNVRPAARCRRTTVRTWSMEAMSGVSRQTIQTRRSTLPHCRPGREAPYMRLLEGSRIVGRESRNDERSLKETKLRLFTANGTIPRSYKPNSCPETPAVAEAGIPDTEARGSTGVVTTSVDSARGGIAPIVVNGEWNHCMSDAERKYNDHSSPNHSLRGSRSRAEANRTANLWGGRSICGLPQYFPWGFIQCHGANPLGIWPARVSLTRVT